jgi:D-glycero-D-manno-heptose 1,7-bisphosphate phosphatase
MQQKNFCNKAVFLDRDGVINIEKEYLYKIEDFEYTTRLFEALKSFEQNGYKLFIITNQSGIGRGYYSEKQFRDLTKWMIEDFKKRSIIIEAVSYCPHTPDDNCNCRKPNPKMILDLSKTYNIDLKKSWLIGDKESDIKSALNAGIENTILVKTGHKIDENNTEAKYIRNSVFDTIDLIK